MPSNRCARADLTKAKGWLACGPVLLVAVFLAGRALATPPYGDPNQPYDQIPGTWETAHVKWAKPLAGGKLNVLFILPYVNAREVVELAQRLELDYTVIMNAGRATWAQGGYEGANATPLKGAEAQTVLNDLADKRLSLGFKYDAIVIGNVSWEAIPRRFRDRLLQHVKRGTGLVYISPNRLKERLYNGLTLISGGGFAEGKDAQFASLFRNEKNTDVSETILASLPLDVMPLKVLHRRDEFARLSKHLRRPSNMHWQSPLHIAVSNFGNGRILSLDYFDARLHEQRSAGASQLTSLAPRVPYDKVMYDYFYALLGRCVLWSANRKPAAHLGLSLHAPKTDLKAPVEKEWRRRYWEYKTPAVVIERHGLTASRLVLSAKSGAHQAMRISIDCRIRDRGGTQVWQKCIPGYIAATKPLRSELPVPLLKRGTYLADCRLMDQDGAVIDSISRSFRVETQLQVTQVTTQEETYSEGDSITGTASFSKPLQKGQRARVTVTDTWDRVVHKGQAALSADRRQATFSFAALQPLCQLWDIHCAIEDRSGEVDSATTWITIPKWTFDNFLWAQFTGSVPRRNWRGRYLLASMRRYGINGAFSTLIYEPVDYQCELFERQHLLNVYYAAHLGQRWASKDLTKEFSGACLSEFGRMYRHLAETGKPLDPKAFPYKSGWQCAEHMNRSFAGRLYDARKFGAPFFLLNSENHLTGESKGLGNSCFCPLCTKRFQDWCRKRCANDIKKLNLEWNSTFKSFDQVRGILLKQAVDRKQLPRWVDFRYFMRSQVFSQYHIDWTDMVRRIIPQARSADAAWANFDYSRFRNHMTCSAVSGGSVLGDVRTELHQSFSQDKGFWMGPGNTLRYMPAFETPLTRARYPWQYLLLGCSGLITGVEVYDMLGGGNYVTADYSEPLPFFRQIGEQVLFLNRGIAKLINTARPQRSKVAILWAPYNHYISRLFPFQENGFSGGSHYNCVADGGAHDDCLTLMNSLRIRPTFIAPDDVCNGILEKRGYKALMLPYSKGMSAAEAEAIRRFVRAGGLVIADNTPGICSSHGRLLDKPRLADMFPVTERAHLVRYGKGCAAYLRNEINGYRSRVETCNYTGSDSVAVLLKRCAGIVSPVELLHSNGVPRRDTLLRVFQHGSALYCGILRAMSGRLRESAPTEVILGKKYHVYDVRQRTYRGYADKIRINLDLYPRLYALLPACPQMMKVSTQQTAVKQGQVVAIAGEVRFGRGEDGTSMGQVVHAEVLNSSGKRLEYFDQNAVFKGGRFKVAIPVSYSESPGRYTVVIEHVVTGMRAETSFDVSTPDPNMTAPGR